jgi:hypothetical protein
MRKKIEYILSTSTFRQSLLATTTTVVTGGLASGIGMGAAVDAAQV